MGPGRLNFRTADTLPAVSSRIRLREAVVALVGILLVLASPIAGSSVAGATRAPDRPVGFRVLDRVDAARPSHEHPTGRPIQISIWYPAVAEGPPLAFSDYVLLTATETSLGAPPPAAAAETLEGYRGFLAQAKVARPDADAWLATKMRASRDAARSTGRAPLVLIAQGNGDSAADQAFLAERLAARGFVVASTPSQVKIGGPMRSEEEIPAQADAQAADLAFALRALRAESDVRGGPYGVVGHSFGARSALLLAMRDPDVAAVVSLDGGIGTKTGKGLLEKAPGFDRKRLKAPLLHLYEEGDPYMPVDLEPLRSLPGEKWLVRVDAMRHVHFSSAGVLAQRIPAVGTATSATPQTGAAWDAVAETTASFFERFLRETGSGRWAPPPSPLLH